LAIKNQSKKNYQKFLLARISKKTSSLWKKNTKIFAQTKKIVIEI